jgi:hypothetical protein
MYSALDSKSVGYKAILCPWKRIHYGTHLPLYSLFYYVLILSRLMSNSITGGQYIENDLKERKRRGLK